MFLPLTENYIANKFYQNCGKPFYNRSQRVYQGSCPICREGKSWLKKKRCYYLVEKNVICCHNCGWYSSPYKWIAKVTGQTFQDIKKELEDHSPLDPTVNSPEIGEIVKQVKEEPLPQDSINLTDKNQVEYYKTNHVVVETIKLINDRRLNTATNRPSSFYVTLNDKVHCNRLIIPFYGSDNKIIFYQSRKVLSDDTRPKYLSKLRSEKSLYGINNISDKLECFFITEGPIDAMFIKNGVAVAGINESKSVNYTKTQQMQLLHFPALKRVWVLDNQRLDATSKKKTAHLIDQGESVFIWPESMSKYKDVNEYCIDNRVDELETSIILSNTYSGLKAKLFCSSY